VVLNPDGAANSTFRYDAFGKCYAATGPFTPRYTFSTKEYLSQPKLYLYAYRVYDPQAGRWTQRDPIDYQDSMNLYQFCGNNPVNATDPLGLAAKKKALSDHEMGNLIYNENKELKNDPNCAANETLSRTNKKMAGVLRNQEANLPEGRNSHAPSTAAATTEEEKRRLAQVKQDVKGATAKDAPNSALHFNHREILQSGQPNKTDHNDFGKVVSVSGSFVGARGKIVYVTFYAGKKRK
jgi:RHS repeat-associated protein